MLHPGLISSYATLEIWYQKVSLTSDDMTVYSRKTLIMTDQNTPPSYA